MQVTPHHRRRAAAALAAGAVGALAGCGGVAPSASGAGVAPATSTPAPAAARRAGTARITTAAFAYAPARIVVRPGTLVTWVNRDAAEHAVSFDAGARRGLGRQRTGAARSVRFTRRGTFAYHCALHPAMAGTIVVR